MTCSHRWLEQTVGAAVLAAGLLVTGCGARSGGDGNANSTVNLASLPAAEVWVDGKAQGSTPLAVPLAPGRHELVLKQTGFAEHRQTLDVASGAVSSVDATLQPLDPMDPDAVRLVAAAYGVTVEPFRAPEVHRGAASVGGVSLLYPRNDVRKEGLAGYRVDVTPAYEGGGWLEFRKGKTSLYRQKFEPDTLVSAAALPPAVLDAVKIGDTVTWGVYFTDARKAITAQFEIVAKPTATKKLAELQADRRLALQPVALRQQLEAEVLQNYRLYSEALVRLLDIHAADKDSAVPYSGIVSCLRRLDLEDTALFSEASSKSGGLAARRRTGDVAGLPTKRLPVGTPSSSGLPTPNDGASAPTAPATPAPTPGDSSAAAPGHRDPVPSLTPPAPSAPGLTPKDPTASKGPVDPNASPIDPKNSPMPPATGPGVAPVAPTPSAPTPPALPGESAMPKPLAPPVPPTPPAGVPVPPADPVAPIGPTPPAQPDAPIPPVQPDGQTPPPPADPVPPMNPPPTTDPVPPMNPPPPADPVPPMNPPPPSDPIPPMQPK